MTDVMVSVRMPKSLLDKLNAYVKANDYLDLSESIRSIVRKKWMEHTNPELMEMKKLREDIKDELQQATIKKVRHEVNNELKKIQQQLKGGTA